MAAATCVVPIEVYLRSEYEPATEYVDGVIEERPTGEWDHSSWQYAIIRWFILHEDEWNVRVRPELRVQVGPTRFRIPDVTIVDRSSPKERIITQPPLAVFEVLSPEDTIQRVLRKLGDYAALGIPQIWVINPEMNAYYKFIDGNLAPESHFGVPGDRIHFAIGEIEAFLS